MNVCIIGHHGNMASRYKAILRDLGHSWIGIDIKDSQGFFDIGRATSQSDAVIIATPTNTHVGLIRALKDCGKPILCEKPITKNLAELETLLEELKLAGTCLQMVSQYDFMPFSKTARYQTVYDYFKHGSDGIWWDCINIVSHAIEEVVLREESPIWHCKINGSHLNIADMDHAYIQMIASWLKEPRADLKRIWDVHKKVHDLEAAACRGS